MHEFHEVSYLRWIALLPLIGAVINFLAGAKIQKALGKNAISAIACLPVLAAFGVSVTAFSQLLGMEPEHRILVDKMFTWLDIGSTHVDFAFQVDPLSAVMIMVVTGVGGLIHLYSTGYMHEEPAYWRYFGYLNLFTFSMLTLVLGDNLLVMFVGWEGVGLCSYGLIGFWFKEWANASAGSKAFIVNRVGDFGMMVGMFLLFWTLDAEGHGTLTFRELAHHAHALEGKTVLGGAMLVTTAITLLMFVGATGKSAQIPLYVWLPDAMAGPTPVSALIHAATMVTAGVYMIARLNFLFAMAPATLDVIATIGALTAFFAATIGTSQFDIKKVLAYSTVSQLGYMFLAMGSGAYAAGVFHLMTHAFFKACLFLGSGSVIHAMHHEQDMRKMGGLKKWMPITHATFFVSCLAIAGIFPLSGFFSKDEILWKAWESGHHFQWFLGFCAAGMTAFYMFRQVFMTFWGECRADHHTQHHLHESPLIMTAPLMILAGLAVVAGLLGVPPALGGSNIFEHWLSPVIGGHHGGAHGAHGEHHDMTMEYVLMLASTLMALSGIFVAYKMYLKKDWSPDVVADIGGGTPYRWVFNKYYVDEFYEKYVINSTMKLTEACAWFDRTVIDGVVNACATATTMYANVSGLIDKYIVDGAVNGVANATSFVGGRVRQLQTGSINAYLYVIVIGFLGVVGVMVAQYL